MVVIYDRFVFFSVEKSFLYRCYILVYKYLSSQRSCARVRVYVDLSVQLRVRVYVRMHVYVCAYACMRESCMRARGGGVRRERN